MVIGSKMLSVNELPIKPKLLLGSPNVKDRTSSKSA